MHHPFYYTHERKTQMFKAKREMFIGLRKERLRKGRKSLCKSSELSMEFIEKIMAG